MNQLKTIHTYIASYPKEVQKLLKELRATIHKAAPEAEETIHYGIPTFALNGNLVHFGAFAHHIGFYPTPSGIKAFAKELKPYEQSKGAVQFPLDKPLPLTIVRDIVQYRVRENAEKKK